MTESAANALPAAHSAAQPRSLWRLVCLITLLYFTILSAILIYKHYRLLNDWPLDQAYLIQQFHNWNSGYPKVTLQPGDQRSGFPGEKPFEESHRKWIYLLYQPLYHLWPQPETLMVVYALLVSLSIPALWLFLRQLPLRTPVALALVAGWIFLPLQQKVAAYTFCDPLSMTGTFYFFYLSLLARDSRWALPAALLLLLPREEPAFLILPAILLFPRKWKPLLLHFACLVPILLLTHRPGGHPFAYAAVSFSPSFLWNFLLTETILWAVALVCPLALVFALVFVGAMVAVGGEIYFQFPSSFLGSSFGPPGGFYYYGPLVPFLLAALALGLARLKPERARLGWLALALVLVPGLGYTAAQFRFLRPASDEVRQIQKFRATVPPDAAVVTDPNLSALFANRDQLFVYLLPPKNVSLPEIFDRANVAIILRGHAPQAERDFLSHSTTPWQRVLQTPNYIFYKKD